MGQTYSERKERMCSATPATLSRDGILTPLSTGLKTRFWRFLASPAAVARETELHADRRESLQRYVASFLVVLVAAAVVATVLARGEDWSRYERKHFSLEHPPSWRVQPFGPCGRRIGPGALFTNLRRHVFLHEKVPGGCSIGWRMNGVPDTVVAVQVARFAWPGGSGAKTELPLGLDRAHVVRRPPGTVFSIPVPDHGAVVEVYFGERAAESDRRAAEKIVDSIEFAG